jgi:hypothetical protein
MKNLVTIILMVLCVVKVNAQEFDSKLLCKKWKIDVESMKPVIAKKLSQDSQFAFLSEAEKEEGILSILETLKQDTIEYKSDGTIDRNGSEGFSKGTWKLDTTKGELITKIDNNKEKKSLLSDKK